MLFITLDTVLKNRNESQYSITSCPDHFQNQRLPRATLQKIRDTAKQDGTSLSRIDFNASTLAHICNMLHCNPADIIQQDLEHDAEIQQTIQYIKSTRHIR